MKNINFEQLKKHKTIIVTGAQRSGTRIASRIIAQEINYAYVDELEFDAHNYDKFLKKIKNKTVIQCPALSHLITKMPNKQDLFFVFMLRNFNDIILSQHRIGWSEIEEPKELNKYKTTFAEYWNTEFEVLPVSVVKFIFWRSVQKPLLLNNTELHYNSLKKHPLFIEKQLRKNFLFNQTE